MSILYIAVTYRTADHARAFLRCFGDAPVGTHVVLVDNTESTHREHVDVETSCRIDYVISPTNLGYFGGARLGLNSARTQGIAPDWVIVCNVDLRFSPNDVHAALHAMDPARFGIVAPSIRSCVSGAELNPFMTSRPSRWRMQAYKYAFRLYWGLAIYSAGARLARKLWQGELNANKELVEEPIYAAHGAFIIFSREYFDRGGDLSHPPFLFGEEITIAERAARLSLPVVFIPTIRISHEEHASTSRLPGRLQHRLVSQAAAHVADTYFS